MTGRAGLERGYGRWLRLYPKGFRREHGAEVLGVLLAGARDGQRRPDPMECLDLLRGALRIRVRPRVPRSDRTAWNAIRLMYLGAAVELASAVVVLATASQVRASLVRRHPDLTGAQRHAVVAGQLEPLAATAGIAVVLWLLMAWAHGRGHRWATPVFAGFFGLNTFGLLHGLAQGSALYARADLAVATALWLVQLAAVALVCLRALGWRSRRRLALWRSGPG